MPEKFAHGVFIARCDPMKAIPARQNSHLAWAITERVHISIKDKSGRGKVTGLRGFGDFVFKHVTGQNMACL